MAITVDTVALGPISSNSYVVTDTLSGESAVIDAGDFNEELKALIGDKKIKYILLTHGHFDHILGVADLKQYTGAEIAVHELDAACLSDEEKSMCACEYGGMQKFVKPDILLKDGDRLYLGETEIKVMHTPGHTPGGVCYIIESEKMIFSGDTLFCLTAGRTDFDGGSAEDLIASLIKLKNLDGDYKVFTGHNRATTLDFERTHNRFMRRMK